MDGSHGPIGPGRRKGRDGYAPPAPPSHFRLDTNYYRHPIIESGPYLIERRLVSSLYFHKIKWAYSRNDRIAPIKSRLRILTGGERSLYRIAPSKKKKKTDCGMTDEGGHLSVRYIGTPPEPDCDRTDSSAVGSALASVACRTY